MLHLQHTVKIVPHFFTKGSKCMFPKYWRQSVVFISKDLQKTFVFSLFLLSLVYPAFVYLGSVFESFLPDRPAHFTCDLLLKAHMIKTLKRFKRSRARTCRWRKCHFHLCENCFQIILSYVAVYSQTVMTLCLSEQLLPLDCLNLLGILKPSQQDP